MNTSEKPHKFATVDDQSMIRICNDLVKVLHKESLSLDAAQCILRTLAGYLPSRCAMPVVIPEDADFRFCYQA